MRKPPKPTRAVIVFTPATQKQKKLFEELLPISLDALALRMTKSNEGNEMGYSYENAAVLKVGNEE